MPLPGTFFVLALHGTTPTCEAWTANATGFTSGATTITAHVTDDALVFEGISRGDTSAWCTASMKLTEDAGGFDVEGARWFRTRSACQAAIAHHAHVATQWPCSPDNDLADTSPATKHRFDDVLAYGGILYAEGTCNRVRFEATKTTAASIAGTLTYRIEGGMEGYDYEGARGASKLVLLGPGATMDDGTSWAMGCGDDITLGYHPDHVDVTAPLYFDQASCKAATERARYRESWLPRDEQDASFGSRPLAGGC